MKTDHENNRTQEKQQSTDMVSNQQQMEETHLKQMK